MTQEDRLLTDEEYTQWLQDNVPVMKGKDHIPTLGERWAREAQDLKSYQAGVADARKGMDKIRTEVAELSKKLDDREEDLLKVRLDTQREMGSL